MKSSGSLKMTIAKSDTPDLKHLDMVREIFRSLSKYISSKQIYTSNNPNLAKFAGSFRKTFEIFFDLESELVLTIDKNHIAWRGQTVYENNKREESIAFLLYKDGVGELRIDAEAPFEELDRFVDIIRSEMHNYSTETDIVSKFWRADFEYIRYRVFENDPTPIAGDGKGEGVSTSTEHIEADDHDDLPSFTDRGRIVAGSCVINESIGDFFKNSINQQYGDAGGGRRESLLQEMLVSNFAASDENESFLRTALEKERSTDKLSSFLGEIMDFARIPGNSGVTGDVQNIIEALTRHILNEADPRVLTQALGVIRAFVKSRTIPEECMPFFKYIEGMFTEDTSLHSLAETAKKSKKDTSDVLGYYRMIGKAAVPAMCSMLEDSNSEWLHTEVSHTIVAVAGEDIHHIIGRLDMDNPHIAHDIVCMFGELKLNAIPSLVRELMYYPDPQVKGQVIKLLVHIGNDEAAGLLVDLLDDDDMHIRMKTLSSVEEIGHPLVTARVTSLAFDEGLELKSIEEQERIYRTLGKLAGDEILPLLEASIRRKQTLLFGFKGPDRRKKILAIRALEQIHSTESMNLLVKLVHDRDKTIKKMAQRALKSPKRPPDNRV